MTILKSALFTLCLFASATLLPLGTASATEQPSGKIKEFGDLTEEDVRNFYDESKKIHKRPYPEYAAFMNLHTTEDALFTLNMLNHRPGVKEPKKQTLIMNKDQFISSLPETYNFIQGSVVKHKVDDIDVNPDGKSARVTDTTYTSNTVELPDAGGKMRKIDVQTQSKCEDLVTSTGKVVKIQKSVCKSENFFFFAKPNNMVIKTVPAE